MRTIIASTSSWTLMRIFTLFCFICSIPLLGDIQDYLKKITDKGDNHKIKGVDCIYLINLDQRPEKYQMCIDQLAPFGITPYRFSAVNGWELSLEAINDVGVKWEPDMAQRLWGTYYPIDGGGNAVHEVLQKPGRNYFCHCMSRGAVGIVLSHLSILQDAYDSGYETIWVMEDDIEVVENPHTLSDYIAKLDDVVGANGWDMLFTDPDTKSNSGVYVSCKGYAHKPNFTPKNPERFATRDRIDSDFEKIGARYGAYSMILRRPAIKKILDHIKTHKIFLPYDMEFYLPSGMRIYTLTKDVVATRIGSPSDNGGANYLNK